MVSLSHHEHESSVTCGIADSVHQLPFFPAARPDEPLGSRCSRYHLERGHEKTRETYRELFGTTPFQISNLYLPRIEALATRLLGDKQANLNRLVHESTLIPLVMLFSQGHSATTRRSIGEEGGAKVCVDCIKQDSSEFGSPHLHLSHLLTVTTVCSRHETRLIDRCPACACPIELPRDLVLSPWQGCHCGARFDELQGMNELPAAPAELALAKFVHDVLRGTPGGRTGKGLARVLRDRAIAQGFRWGDGKVDRRGLFVALEEHYTPAFLKTVDAAYAKDKTDGWLQFLGQTDYAAEGPLARNLLLANFLFEDGASFVASASRAMDERVSTPSGRATSSRNQSAASPDFEECELERLIAQLAGVAASKGLSFGDLWLKRVGAMKRLTKLGGKDGIEKLRSAIENHSKLPSKKKGVGLSVHPKDSEWADSIKDTAARLYSDPAKPNRVTISALVKMAECRPEAWPDAARFPLTRAACEAAQESQWHFYARRMVWSMSRHFGKNVARTVITEDSGLEHHRANDVYYHLSALNIVPTAPFLNRLEEKGIPRDWKGPCPEKVYRKAGRGYIRTGARTAYVPPPSLGNVSVTDSLLPSP